jgi:hypothetical protein
MNSNVVPGFSRTGFVASGLSRTAAITLCAMFLFPGAARPQSATTSNPWLGKWTMNIAKSTLSGTPPKSATHWFVETPDGMTQIIEQVTADGRKLRSEVTAKLDGKDYAVGGDAQRDSTRAFRRIDRRTLEITNKTDGKMTSTIREVISADGKTRTATTTGRNATSSNVLVFDRQ